MRLLLRRVAQGLALLLLVVMAWTGIALLQARGDLLAARQHLQTAGDAEGLPQVRQQLDRAEARLTEASAGLHRPGPAAAALLPLLGRTVTAVRTAADAALAVVAAGGDVLEATPDALLSAGTLDTDGLARMASAAEKGSRAAASPVERLDEVELSLVPGAVAGPVREVRERLHGVPDELEQAARGAAGVRSVLGGQGEKRVLLMLQNNAELRGTGGLVTVFAEATARDGRLDVRGFRDVEEVADRAATARRVPAPADYRQLWGPFLADSTLWVNTNMTPDVPTASAVLADVAVASGLQRPDVVVWFDVRAIAAALEATGPVRLPDGSELSADSAVDVLLSQAYAEVEDTFEAQAARRATLRAAADAVLDGIFSPASRLDVAALGPSLATAVRGRHVSLWADDPATQQDLVDGGLAAGVSAAGGDLSAFTVQNFGGGDGQGNKLDYYARRQVTLDVVVQRDVAVVEQQVTVRNNAPGRGLPRYVAGGLQPGTSRNYVTLAVPLGADVTAFRRGDQDLGRVQARQGDHAVLTDGVELAPGAEVTWTLRYRLPVQDGSYALQVLPQPLAVDAGLRASVRPGRGLTLLGHGVTGDRLLVSGPFAQELQVKVLATRPSPLRRAVDAVRRFWTEPVRLP